MSFETINKMSPGGIIGSGFGQGLSKGIDAFLDLRGRQMLQESQFQQQRDMQQQKLAAAQQEKLSFANRLKQSRLKPEIADAIAFADPSTRKEMIARIRPEDYLPAEGQNGFAPPGTPTSNLMDGFNAVSGMTPTGNAENPMAAISQMGQVSGITPQQLEQPGQPPMQQPAQQPTAQPEEPSLPFLSRNKPVSPDAQAKVDQRNLQWSYDREKPGIDTARKRTRDVKNEIKQIENLKVLNESGNLIQGIPAAILEKFKLQDVVTNPTTNVAKKFLNQLVSARAASLGGKVTNNRLDQIKRSIVSPFNSKADWDAITDQMKFDLEVEEAEADSTLDVYNKFASQGKTLPLNFWDLVRKESEPKIKEIHQKADKALEKFIESQSKKTPVPDDVKVLPEGAKLQQNKQGEYRVRFADGSTMSYNDFLSKGA